jgi:hypothetical protein
MTRDWILLGLLCGALVMPGFALAQDADDDVDRFGPEGNNWELTLNGSGFNDRDFDNGAFGGGFSVGYFFNENFELSLRQTVNYADTEAINGSDTIASTRLAADIHFDSGRLQPFIGANFGGVYGDAIADTFAAAPEVGAKFYVKPEVFLMLLGEYQFFFKDIEDADDRFENGQFVYTVGVGFNW